MSSPPHKASVIVPERLDSAHESNTTNTTPSGSDSDSDPLAEVTQETLQYGSSRAEVEARLRLKVDLRLCTIAGILCSLNLLDSGIISSASVSPGSKCYTNRGTS